MAKTLGRIYGRRCVSFICNFTLSQHAFPQQQDWDCHTSSSSDGNIFRILKPSENLLKTLVRPFMKDIFSSRVFAVKFDRSKKLSVEIGSEEKKGWDGRVAGVGRLWDPRVTSDRKRSWYACYEDRRKGGDQEGKYPANLCPSSRYLELDDPHYRANRQDFRGSEKVIYLDSEQRISQHRESTCQML